LRRFEQVQRASHRESSVHSHEVVLPKPILEMRRVPLPRSYQCLHRFGRNVIDGRPGGSHLEALERSLRHESGQFRPDERAVRRAPPDQETSVTQLRESFAAAIYGHHDNGVVADRNRDDVVATRRVDLRDPTMELRFALTPERDAPDSSGVRDAVEEDATIGVGEGNDRLDCPAPRETFLELDVLVFLRERGGELLGREHKGPGLGVLWMEERI